MDPEINYDLLPEHDRGGMWRYIEKGIRPGSFLRAVICNDLAGAFSCADRENRELLGDIVAFLWNEAPAECWGSPLKMSNWVGRRGLDRTGDGPND